MATFHSPGGSRSTFVTLALIITALLVGLPAQALGRTFMFINSLPGESADDQHKNWIDLISYAQTVGAKPCARIVVFKNLDKASPGLAALAVSNQRIPTVVVEVVKEGAERFLLFRATLGNVIVDVTETMDQEGGGVTEKVALLPRTVGIEYFPQDAAGRPLPPITGAVSC